MLFTMDHRFDSDSVSSTPLHSEFEMDPDLRDLVVLFVDELDDRITSIKGALEDDDHATLRRLAHQLKGSAGGYGFDPIGDAAARLEYELLGDQAELSTITERAEDLISTCRAAVRPEDG